MGSGSSSYRPKAIYLDIDGRIQKVAPPRLPPRPRGTSRRATPGPASPPTAAPARVTARGSRRQRRVGDLRPCVRASERPGVRAVVSDNFGGGGRALRSGFPTNWIPVGGDDPRHCFHFMGRAFFVTNLLRLSL